MKHNSEAKKGIRIILLTIWSLAMMLIGSALYEYSHSPFDFTPVKAANGCVIDAVAFESSLLAHTRLTSSLWSRVILYYWTDPTGKRVGHAVCVFQYKNRFFIYDPEKGSWYILGFDPKKIPLSNIVAKLVPPGSTQISAEYLE